MDRTNRDVESQGGCELQKVIACNDGCTDETKRNDYLLLNDMLLHCPWNSTRRQFAAAAPHLDPTAHLQNKDKELMPFLHLTDCQCDIKPEEKHFLSRMLCRLAFNIVCHVCGSFVLCFLCKVPMQQIWLLALNLLFGICELDILAVQRGQVSFIDKTGMQRCIVLKGWNTVPPGLKLQSPDNEAAHPSLDKSPHGTMKRLCRVIKDAKSIVDLEDTVSIGKAREAAQRLETLVRNWDYVSSSFILCTHLLQATIALVCHVMCV